MLSPRQRILLLLVTALLIAPQGSALARRKKKHHAARAHHGAPAQTPAADDKGEPAAEEEPPAGGKTAAEPEPEQTGEGESTPSGAPVADEDREPPPTKRRPPGTPTAKQAEASGTASRLPPALQAGIRLGGLYRRLSWNQVSSGTLIPFSVSPALQAGLRVEFYPAALVGRDFGANVGALLAFDRGFGVTTRGPSGDVSGIFEDFLLGFKIRFPVGLFVPYGSIAYGGQAFLFSPRLPAVPSVFYTFVRLAAGARLQLTDAIDLDVGAGYLPVVDAGKQAGYLQSSDYFPTASAYALEATGSLGVRIAGILGLRAGVDFRQFTVNTSNAGGTMFTAQGATDRFLTPWLMIEIVVDGAGPAGGGPED